VREESNKMTESHLSSKKTVILKNQINMLGFGLLTSQMDDLHVMERQCLCYKWQEQSLVLQVWGRACVRSHNSSYHLK